MEAFHLNVAGAETPVAPFEGELKAGAAGGSDGGAPNNEYKSLFGVPDGIPVMTFGVAAEVRAPTT